MENPKRDPDPKKTEKSDPDPKKIILDPLTLLLDMNYNPTSSANPPEYTVQFFHTILLHFALHVHKSKITG
jgi:hypothetical protein